MSLTPSTMPELGVPAPDFDLPDPRGQQVSLDSLAAADALLVVFWCNHCPYVKHIQRGFVDFANDYASSGLAVVAICANDATTHPGDSPEAMRAVAEEWAYPFPYLHDASQETARAYDAACTPDFFLYDKARRLVYRGRFDAATPGNEEPVSGAELRDAVDAVLAGKPLTGEQRASIGCNIKWR